MGIKSSILATSLGLEDDSVLPGEGEPGEVVIPEELQAEEIEVSNGAAEVEVEAEQVEAADEATEELVEAGEGLEAICISLESIVNEGGLDKNGYVMARLALDASLSRFKGLSDTIQIPALENFESATDRVQNTQLGLEAVTETLKKIWQAIKDTVLKAIAFVASFVAKLFSNFDKLAESAKALKKRAASTKGKAADKVKVGGLHNLAVGTDGSAKGVLGGLNTLATVVGEGFEKCKTDGITYFQSLTDMAAAMEASKDSTSGAAAIEAFNAAAGKGTKNYTSKTFSGNYAFVAKPDGAGYAGYDVVRVGKGSISPSAEVAAASTADVAAIAEAVLKVIAAAKKEEAVLKTLNDKQKSALTAVEKVVNKFDAGSVSKFLTRTQVSFAAARTKGKFTAPLAKLSNIAFVASRTAIQYGSTHLNAYKEEKAAA